MEPRERHEIALLGVCCTTGQKDLLLMRKVVKNFFEITQSKTDSDFGLRANPDGQVVLRILCCAGKRSLRHAS
jgi:hypothetical protein